jgi:hypothetical protein
MTETIAGVGVVGVEGVAQRPPAAASPAVDELVAGDAEPPGDRHLVDRTAAGPPEPTRPRTR